MKYVLLIYQPLTFAAGPLRRQAAAWSIASRR